MGSTPHAHAQADVKTPQEQGVIAMIGVFINSFAVFTVTALVVISTLYADGGILSTPEGATASLLSKANMLQTAVGEALGSQTAGNVIVAICLTFFAFTTIISWNFFGKQSVEYLFGKRATVVYSALAIGFIFLGSLFRNELVWELVWELADMFNNLMLIPNVFALAVLSGMVTRHARAKKQNPPRPIADPKNSLNPLGIYTILV